MAREQFSLRWNNYSSHIQGAFDSLRNEDDLVDVTLSCDGGKIRAHKIMLSACSPYFRELFKDNPCHHPIVILRQVHYADLSAIVTFMYHGEVSVVGEQLSSFLQTAELLEVRGLTDSGRDTPEPKSPQPDRKSPNVLKETHKVFDNQRNLDGDGNKTRMVATKRKRVSRPASPVQNNRPESPDPGTKIKVAKSKSIIKERLDNTDNTDIFNSEMNDLIDVSELNQKGGYLSGRTSNALTSTPTTTPTQGFVKDESGEHGVPGCEVTDAIAMGSTVLGGEQDGKTMYPCRLCLKVFKHPDSLRQHYQSHTGGTKCPICSAVMSRKYELKVHMRKKHHITT